MGSGNPRKGSWRYSKWIFVVLWHSSQALQKPGDCVASLINQHTNTKHKKCLGLSKPVLNPRFRPWFKQPNHTNHNLTLRLSPMFISLLKHCLYPYWSKQSLYFFAKIFTLWNDSAGHFVTRFCNFYTSLFILLFFWVPSRSPSHHYPFLAFCKESSDSFWKIQYHLLPLVSLLNLIDFPCVQILWHFLKN